MTRQRPNYLAGFGSLVWLGLIGLPLYVLLIATFRTQSSYSSEGPLTFPHHLTLQNYATAFSNGFGQYFLNTLIVTASVVAIVLLVVPPLAYTVVRARGRTVSLVFRLFLLGLAVPVQAVIVPMFYLINQAGLYDSLIGLILPTAAFSLPVCTLVLTGTMREITSELYEAMTMDGASPFRVFWQLVLPLSKGGLSSIVVFAALQAWNGFLFPLIMTQSNSTKVATLGLYNFVSTYSADVPALLAAVLMSAVPILVVYLFARRALVAGLMGAGGK